MAYTIILQEEAIEDIQQAYDWYEEQLPNLGEEFLEQLYSVFNQLQFNLQYFGFLFNDFRDARLTRFPYLVVFKIEADKVIINSVRHTRRNPPIR